LFSREKADESDAPEPENGPRRSRRVRIAAIKKKEEEEEDSSR
jgi:hypothetical protein